VARRLPPSIVLAVGLALLAGGCASSSAAGAASPSGFRSSYASARPQLHRLEAELSGLAAGSSAGSSAGSGLGQRAYTLAVAANHVDTTVSGLQAPTRYNTRLRDLRAALLSLVTDLSAVSATAGHSAAATASAEARVRTDAADVGEIDTGLAQALGLRP
jgi:hypothetical protein